MFDVKQYIIVAVLLCLSNNPWIILFFHNEYSILIILITNECNLFLFCIINIKLKCLIRWIFIHHNEKLKRKIFRDDLTHPHYAINIVCIFRICPGSKQIEIHIFRWILTLSNNLFGWYKISYRPFRGCGKENPK